MAYIQTIPLESATGELREIYDQLLRTRGKLADVHQIQSLHPSALITHMEMYKAIMFNKSSLKRYQREMIAVVVSAANQCRYCIEHHGQALLFYWKDEARYRRLIESIETADLNETDLALCRYARQVTLEPHTASKEAVQHLRALGVDDKGILDAVQVTAYFNFVNRIVLALGLEFDEEETKGYNY